MSLNLYIYLACEQLQNFMMEAAETFIRVGKHFSQIQTMAGAAEIPLG